MSDELLDLSQVRIDPAIALQVPASLTLRRKVLPFAQVDQRVFVACANPQDAAALRALKRHFKQLEVVVRRAEASSLQAALDRTYGDGDTRHFARSDTTRVRLAAGAEIDDDAVSRCDELLRAAILRQASDLHIDPERDGVRVRLRVDGQLEDLPRLPLDALAGVISRFKVLSDMDIAEKRAPQDGRFTHRFGAGKVVELRTATLPTQHGERMTLRLLALQTAELTLEKLGLFPEQLALVDAHLKRPHGMFLVTGPTGSGKSTTLYAAVRRLIAMRPLNVITVEDPVEFDMQGAAQVEVDSADKVSFLRALRSILRHDPDVVMIGEVRDRETADVAIKASLTGHLVLSTLHTNSALGAITRLRDMGVEPYLLAACLRLVAAQRLVRQLCRRCAVPRALAPDEAALFGQPQRAGAEVKEPRGCLYCGGRGLVGRLGLFEVVELAGVWRERVAGGYSEPQLLDAMRADGLPTLADNALRRVLAGDTPVSEALAAVATG
ncbi:MAG: GspE/PulE family protein [Planctomycetota bacterium]